ncbi:MAG: hypothetical protein ACRDOK_01680 [Streptosporangiaceae bacterium]
MTIAVTSSAGTSNFSERYQLAIPESTPSGTYGETLTYMAIGNRTSESVQSTGEMPVTGGSAGEPPPATISTRKGISAPAAMAGGGYSDEDHPREKIMTSTTDVNAQAALSGPHYPWSDNCGCRDEISQADLNAFADAIEDYASTHHSSWKTVDRAGLMAAVTKMASSGEKLEVKLWAPTTTSG